MVVVSILLLIYSYCYSFYFIIFSIAGLFNKKDNYATDQIGSFLILIPAYKEDNVILKTVSSILENPYPKTKYHITVIADSFSDITITKLNELPINIHEVNFNFSTKGKSINSALQAIDVNKYDWILIVDADNKLDNDALFKFNACMHSGIKASQGHRTTYDLSSTSPFTILDAISEEINNNIFRRGHRSLGLSSALIGSGMCFEISLYTNLMRGLDKVGDEDGGLEFRIFQAGEKIEYLEDCLVFDEKVASSHIFGKQRSRWIAGQFSYLSSHFKDFLNLFSNFNIDFLNKYLQKFLIPRLFFLLIVGAFSVLSIFYPSIFNIYLWFGCLSLFLLANLLAIPRRFYKLKYLPVLIEIPKALFHLTKEMLSVKSALKKNYHTPHGTIKKEQ